jgi:hypothetical protein
MKSHMSMVDLGGRGGKDIAESNGQAYDARCFFYAILPR